MRLNDILIRIFISIFIEFLSQEGVKPIEKLRRLNVPIYSLPRKSFPNSKSDNNFLSGQESMENKSYVNPKQA